MKRIELLAEMEKAFRVNPVLALLGPRQCGKTTLARDFLKHSKSRKGQERHLFDLENPRDLARLENPMIALENLGGTVVIDEIQRAPRLFETLRVLVDETHRKVRYLILGSASRDLIRQSSETLAGRISYLELTPFSAREVGPAHLERLWVRGGFPLSYLAQQDLQSFRWREEYIATYLERDVPALGFQIPAATLRRFWMMLVHAHGQVLNASEIGRSMGVAHTTVRHYLDLLSGTFMIRQLPGWVENIGKRQVRSPKIYFRDSGIFHALLGVRTAKELKQHLKLGASWEGFALEEIIRAHRARPEEVYFWGTHNQAELDLLILKDGRRLGYEIKFTDAPRVTKSMHIALEDLKLDQLTVVFYGRDRFPMGSKIQAAGLETFAQPQWKPSSF